MQLWDREKSSIILTFILNIVLILIFLFLGIYHTHWKYKIIEWYKEELKVVTNSISSLESEWISFWDFNKLKSQITYIKTEYLNIVLKNINVSFYNNNFINKKWWKFEDFINEKKLGFYSNEELLALTEDELERLDDDIEEKVRNEKSRKEKMITVLPSYNPDLKEVDENLLTDFKFVNYIESIIKTFNLEIDSSIWIGNISSYSNWILENKSKKAKKINTWGSKIFFIPIKLSVLWSKEDVINFLHYIVNVWNIDVKDGGFDVVEDDELSYSDKRKMVLVWDYNKTFWNGKRYRKSYDGIESLDKYNIYNHQVIDIESISMPEYPVSYYITEERGELWFIDFLKTDAQKDGDFIVNLDLRFYIKWVPDYKMIEFIKWYIKDYNDTKILIAKQLALLLRNKDTLKDWDVILLKNQYEKANAYLNSITQDIKKLEITLKKWTWIDVLYKNSLDNNKILRNIVTVLWLSDENFDTEIIAEIE